MHIYNLLASQIILLEPMIHIPLWNANKQTTTSTAQMYLMFL